MKIRGVFPDLLATLGRASSPEVGFARALRRLVTLCGATAGGLCFLPGRGAPLLITAGTRRGSALDGWLRARLGEAGRRMRLRPVDAPPPGWRGRPPVLLRAALGEHAAPLGQFLLLGGRGPGGLRADRIPSGFPRELGLAMEQIWRLHQRTLRLEVINEVTALMATTLPLERIYQRVADAVGRLIRFDALGLTLLDRERREVRVLDVAARTTLSEVYDLRTPLGDTLTEWVADHRVAARVPLGDPGAAVLGG